MTVVTVLPCTRFAVNTAGVATDIHNYTPPRFVVSSTGTVTDRK